MRWTYQATYTASGIMQPSWLRQVDNCTQIIIAGDTEIYCGYQTTSNPVIIKHTCKTIAAAKQWFKRHPLP